MKLTILSYNIHKGFSSGNWKFILGKIRESIESVNADLVLLQEVVGHHEKHASRHADWPTVSQFEFLADRLWPHFAYGKNAVYEAGHHGNAILSKYPITFWENQDVSKGPLESRGLLHAAIEVPGLLVEAHVVCTHLGLFETDRARQIEDLCARIHAMVPDDAPLVVGGDFNDWRGKASAVLKSRLGMEEAFFSSSGRHAATFPSWLPTLKLDRLYYRGLRCRAAHLESGGIWKDLSDHLPIIAELELP